MGNSSTQEKINNGILSLLVVIGLFAFCAYFFDFFYDLNDDMVIKDILSGAYSGTPNGHTNQMLYPLGAVISFCYRILSKVPFFALFLWGSMAACFGMIHYRVQGFLKDYRAKTVTAVFLFFLFLSLTLWELVYVQYSVVCGILSGTACFWFYTTPIDSSVEEFWKNNIPALVLAWLAFMVRSEMLLLTGPFIAVAGIWHWAEFVEYQKENNTEIGRKTIWNYIFSKLSLKKYVAFVILLLLGLGLLLGMDTLAFRGEQWKQYRDFFDARTTLYDYNWYPDYDKEQQFYQENGIDRIQYQLIDTYNFGLDETITANTLDIISSFKEKPKVLGSVGYRIKNALTEPVERLFSGQDKPYNYFVVMAYGLVLGLAVVQKDKNYYWKLALLFVVRFIPWFYLTFVQRALDRIAHPLYIIEFLLLFAMLSKQLYDRPLWNAEKYYRLVVVGAFMLVVIATLPLSFRQVKTEQLSREENLAVQKLWDEYAKSNPENYYYMDVYSTVLFMEKMFEDVDNGQKNYDLLGGWVCHSPLQEEARRKYLGLLEENNEKLQNQNEEEISRVDIAEALLLDNFYFVAEKNCDIGFLEKLYLFRKIPVTIEVEDTVGNGENPFLVYRIAKE